MLATAIDIRGAAENSNLTIFGAGEAGFSNYLSTILNAVVVLAVLLLLLYLVWGGIDWITAGGDSGKVGKARDKITQGVIGIIVLASSIAILMLVQNLFGVKLIGFGSIGESSIINQGNKSGVYPATGTKPQQIIDYQGKKP